MAIAILKNTDSGVTFTGSWTSALNTNPGFSTNYIYKLCTGNNTPTATYSFKFSGLTAGTTYMLAWFIQSNVNRAADQLYKVFDTDGTTLLWSGNISGQAAFTDFTYSTGAVYPTPTAPGFIWLGKFTPTGTSLTVYTDNTGANSGKYAVLDAAYLQLATDAYTPIYSTRQSGTWSDATVSSAGVPGSPWRTGDIPSTASNVTIGTNYTGTHVITVAANLTQGTSPLASGDAIIINDNHTLLIADGVTLTCQGGIQLVQTTTTRTAGFFPLQIGTGTGGGGAVLEFDGHVNTQAYTAGPTANAQTNAQIKLRGVSGNLAELRSNAGGPNGYISNRGFSTAAMGVDAQFAKFTRIGDATNGLCPSYGTLTTTASSLVDVLFDSCGLFTDTTTYGTATRLQTINSKNAYSFYSGTGTAKSYTDCRFDAAVKFYPPTGTSVSGCAFMGGYSLLTPYIFTAWSNNFASTDAATGASNATNSYYFDDVATGNPHPLVPPPASTAVSGLVFDCPSGSIGDMICGGPGAGNTVSATYCVVLPNYSGGGPGELISPIGVGAGWTGEHNTVTATVAITNSEAGVGVYGETWPGVPGMYASLRSNLLHIPSGHGSFLLRHNTGWTSDAVANSSGNLLADYNGANANVITSANSPTFPVYGANGGYYDAFNFTTTPALLCYGGTAGAFTLKVYRQDGVVLAGETASIAFNATAAVTASAIQTALNGTGTDATYVVTGSGTSPSTGVAGVTLTVTRNGSALTSAHAGTILRTGTTNTTGGTFYFAGPMFTSTTGLGTHDVIAAPGFVDTTRNLATFDTAYLGNTAGSAWATGTAYSVGDIVSSTDATVYGGATINYRCILAHTSLTGNATNGKPVVATSWKTNWEYAGLYRLRVTTPVAYNAAVRQATPQDLITWVKAGFAPTNTAFKGTAHDGGDIGAISVYVASSAGVMLGDYGDSITLGLAGISF